jgi:tetratricopeptide (TPR) repeat protein
VTLSANAQVDKKDVRRGNRDFRKENYKEAEIDYRKALVKDSLSLAANYNLAGTLYRTGDMEQAKQALERIKDSAPASDYGADYYFNLGDVAIAMQDWQGAVEAFGKSLLINPGDLQAKENYIYARKKLQDQQQNQQNQNDQNQDQQNDQNQNDQNQDQQNNQDDQNQDKKDDGDDKQDQNGQDQNKQDQPQQGQQPKISPQAAQQMLQAIQAKEKETQDKVNKQKAEALKSRQKEKNW